MIAATEAEDGRAGARYPTLFNNEAVGEDGAPGSVLLWRVGGGKYWGLSTSLRFGRDDGSEWLWAASIRIEQARVFAGVIDVLARRMEMGRVGRWRCLG